MGMGLSAPSGLAVEERGIKNLRISAMLGVAVFDVPRLDMGWAGPSGVAT